MSKEMEPQNSLLPEYPNLSPEELQQQIAETARKIAENADKRGPIEYEDRTSEAAKDQGHGTANVFDIENISKDNPGARKEAQQRRTHPSHQPVEYPDDEHKEAAAKNGPLARKALNTGPEANDPDTHSPTIELPKSPGEIARIARGRTYADIIRRNWAANRKK